ncbi:MAG: secretin N-terminal domain-containing protein, partial [Pirellulales bacterium]
KPDGKSDDEKKEADKDEEDKKEKEGEKPKTIQRPDEPPEPADPEELKVKPDDDGMIQFSFRGQKWPDVLDWLSRVSGMSLDWQELPNDYLNLTTQRRYSIEEARDLINRHLLSRGFTLLESGEILSVAKTETIDPSMVPRVEAEQLAERRPHEFVKVSFALDWLIAETAVEEFKPMLSPNGKLTALRTTNRIEAMDAVANLRAIHDLLKHEQSDTVQERLFKEFILKYTKASDVVSQLESLLGIEKKRSPAPAAMSRQQMEMMQQQQRMMAEMQKRSAKKPAPASSKQPEVHLVVNPRKNSILAKAPPDQMVIIEQAVKAIDVPADRLDSLLLNPTRVQVYRLHAIDPGPLVRTLEEIGGLDPSTRLQVDEKNKAIIAFAPLVDHMIIRQLVDRLDGSGRRFEVIQLRRLASDYVAGTVEFMMVGGKKEEQSSRYDYYSYRYGRRDDSEPKDQFRVDADIESNRLLLWASEIEIEEVMNLLVKLGELPPEGGGQSTIRVLDAISADEAEAFLERLRRAWPSLAPNRLQLPAIQPDEAAEEPPPAKTPPADPSIDARDARWPTAPRILTTALLLPVEDSPESAAPDRPATPPAAKSEPPREEVPGAATAEALQTAPRGGSDRSDQGTAPPPIHLSIGPDGRIVISSQDVAALNLLEEVIDQLAPPHREYEIFRLKHADAYWVKDNIEKFFEEEDESNRPRSPFFFYGYPEPSKSKSRSRLSSRRKLKFIYDLDTNSILVQGADPQQLKTIQELVDVYDQPEPTDSQTARVSTIFPIKYSRASVIADSIKDVFRDLLSSNDKALGQKNPEQKKRSSEGFSYILGVGDSGAPERTKATFKGKLSIGVDDVTNTLLVSTEGENLMQNISKMIDTLDEAAKPVSTVSVVRLNGGVNAAHVRDVLNRILSETDGKGAKKAANAVTPGPPAGEKKPSSPTAVLSAAPR